MKESLPEWFGWKDSFFCLAALISTDIGLVLRLHLPLKWAVVPNLDADPGPDSIAAKPKLCSDATKIPNLVVSDPPRASAFSFFIALFYFLLKTGRPKQSQGRDELKGSLHRNRKNWVNRTQFWRYQGIVPYPVMRHSLKERRQRLLEAENLIFLPSLLCIIQAWNKKKPFFFLWYMIFTSAPFSSYFI